MGADKIEVIQPVSVAIDIEPGTCPNLLNAKSHGHVKVSIEGTASFDVTTVDPASVRLEGVSANRSVLRDVSGQLDTLDCSHGKPDGYTDLVLNFDIESVVATMGDVQDGEVRTLTLTGTLVDGTPIQGEDVVMIKKPGKNPGKNSAKR